MKSYFYDEGQSKCVSIYDIENITTAPRRNAQENYKPLKIGEPILVQYLRFFIYNPEGLNEKKNEVLITTQIKTEPSKLPAPEMVNYFNKDVPGHRDTLDIGSIGGDKYGHELCYYDPSYKGQDIRLTVKGVEVDKLLNRHVKAIKKSVSQFSKLPYVSALKIPDNILDQGIELATTAYNIINPNDILIQAHDLDLFYKHINRPTLKSGRYILSQSNSDLGDGYSLNNENHLIYKDEIEKKMTYVVLQVNNHQMDVYKNFDQFQESNKYLEMINDNYEVESYIDNLTKMVLDYKDVDMMLRVNKLLDNKPVDLTKEQLEMGVAYINSMSDEMKMMFNKEKKSLQDAIENKHNELFSR